MKRVLGRIMVGREVSEAEATAMTRWMCPRNPWLLDAPLYGLGKEVCTKRRPACSECRMRRVCVFFKARRGDRQ